MLPVSSVEPAGGVKGHRNPLTTRSRSVYARVTSPRLVIHLRASWSSHLIRNRMSPSESANPTVGAGDGLHTGAEHLRTTLTLDAKRKELRALVDRRDQWMRDTTQRNIRFNERVRESREGGDP